MATWDEQASPLVKFELSPAESFISTPGEMYPSLFHPSTTPQDTLNPLDVMTPPAFNVSSNTDDDLAGLAGVMSSSADPDLGADYGSPAPGDEDDPSSPSEKKAVKKRKSWGQVLPEPKTNLPPRKRAKTEDEKEQRRVERVLRNRRAAQSSRERKRQEVDALEKRNKELETRLVAIEKTNIMLIEELSKYRRTGGVVTRSSASLDPLPSNNITLSQELFSSQDGHTPLIGQLMFADPANTVNPSSLSPEATPSPSPELNSTSAVESAARPVGSESAAASPTTTGPSIDMTQRPAAMLCDLQCQQSMDLPQHWMSSQTSLAQVSPLQLHMLLLLSSALISACQRPMTQIAMSLKAGFSLPPTPTLLKTIILLVTRPRSPLRTRSTSPTTSTTTATETSQPRRTPTAYQRTSNSATTSPTLRLTSLRKILTCSPTLARPLSDATMEALRLVSEERDDQAVKSAVSDSLSRDVKPKHPAWLGDSRCPSRETLLALLWAIKVEERKLQSNLLQVSVGEAQVPSNGRKRKNLVEFRALREKRQRLS